MPQGNRTDQAKAQKPLPVCKFCYKVGHYQTFCPLKPKKRIKTASKTLRRIRIKKVGKYTSKWFAYRKDYLERHPPNHEGYYECYLCHMWIPEKEITLDHIIPRSKDKTLVYVDSNIGLCCSTCNSEKASKIY